VLLAHNAFLCFIVSLMFLLYNAEDIEHLLVMPSSPEVDVSSTSPNCDEVVSPSTCSNLTARRGDDDAGLSGSCDTDSFRFTASTGDTALPDLEDTGNWADKDARQPSVND